MIHQVALKVETVCRPLPKCIMKTAHQIGTLLYCQLGHGNQRAVGPQRRGRLMGTGGHAGQAAGDQKCGGGLGRRTTHCPRCQGQQPVTAAVQLILEFTSHLVYHTNAVRGWYNRAHGQKNQRGFLALIIIQLLKTNKTIHSNSSQSDIFVIYTGIPYIRSNKVTCLWKRLFKNTFENVFKIPLGSLNLLLSLFQKNQTVSALV